MAILDQDITSDILLLQ